MAGNADKKRLARNAEAMKTYTIGTAVSFAVFVLLKLVLQSASTTKWTYGLFVVTLGMDAFILMSLNTMYDLGASGTVAEYYKDVLFITWFCLVVSVYTMAVNWIYAVIPVFAIYKAWSLCAPLLAGSGSPDPEPINESSKERKARLKRERKMQKKLNRRR